MWIIPQKYLKFLAERQVEFQTAWTILQYFATLGMYETFAMVFCSRFDIYGTVAW